MSRRVVITIAVVVVVVLSGLGAVGVVAWSRTFVDAPVYSFWSGTALTKSPGRGVVYGLDASDRFVIIVTRDVSTVRATPAAQMQLMVRRTVSTIGFEMPDTFLYADLAAGEYDWIRAHGIPASVERKFVEFAEEFDVKPLPPDSRLGPGIAVPIEGLIGVGSP
ncbi:MAG: hypothetical protein K2X32_04625 [Phycisphaerales bacterium]|nr:hypothetical protein [Phycisphaerales bacterium]